MKNRNGTHSTAPHPHQQKEWLGGSDLVLIERIRTNHNSIVPDQNRICTRSYQIRTRSEPDLYSIVLDRTRSEPDQTRSNSISTRSVLDRTRERGFSTNQYSISTRLLLDQYQIRTMPARSVLNQNRGPDQYRSARITTNQYPIAPASSHFLQISTRSQY